MKRALFVMLLSALGAALAQEAQPPQPQSQSRPRYVQRIFEIKHAEVQRLADLLTFFQARIKAEPGLRLIAVGTEDQATMTAIEETIKRYDVARGPIVPSTVSNIETIVHILAASPKGTAGDAVPADLEPVAKQLRATFGYTDIRVLDSIIVRSRDGEEVGATGNAPGVHPNAPASRPARYSLSFRTRTSSGDRGRHVRLENFRFNMSAPIPGDREGTWGATEVGFRTDLDVREGQKAVVGKAKVDSSDTALVLVVTARVVE